MSRGVWSSTLRDRLNDGLPVANSAAEYKRNRRMSRHSIHQSIRRHASGVADFRRRCSTCRTGRPRFFSLAPDPLTPSKRKSCDSALARSPRDDGAGQATGTAEERPKSAPSSRRASNETPEQQSSCHCHRDLDPAHYFGGEARDLFFQLFKDLSRRESACLSGSAWCWGTTSETGEPSPRDAFGRAVVEQLQRVRALEKDAEMCLPEPAFVRMLEGSESLEIAHRSYGDGLAMLLAPIITKLPKLRRLSMRDNRLTDKGIAAILGSVCACIGREGLESLDLSQNTLDTEAVASVASFLRRPDCVLASLFLDSADVDDDELRILADALEHNTSLKSLSLSSNFLGGFAEKLQCSSSDVFAIEPVLKTNTTLCKLDISWNQLGKNSADAVARALPSNRALAWLSIAYNCIGDQGGMALGFALNWNSGLQYLDASHNGIRNRGGQVIAEGLRENTRLTHLDLSGNPVGKLGGRALIGSLNFSLRPRKIVLRGCECTNDDLDPGRYNPASPAGTYTLDLAQPHHWMIAQSLLWLTVTRSGCQFVKLQVVRPGEPPADVELLLPRVAGTSLSRRMSILKTPTQATTLTGATTLTWAAQNKFRSRVKTALVAETYDALVGSGDLTASGFRNLVRKILKLSPADLLDDEVTQLFRLIDKDGNRVVDAAELEQFVTEDENAHSTPQATHRIANERRRAVVDAKSATTTRKTPRTASQALFIAICKIQARVRGIMARIDISQTKMMFDGGIRSSSVAKQLMSTIEEDMSKPTFLSQAAAAKRQARRLSGSGGRSAALRKKKNSVQPGPSRLGKARFRAVSKYAVASSREMRAHLRAHGPVDASTGKPWRVPEAPARLDVVFEQIPLPPTEFGIQNASGISGLLNLMLDNSADRVVLMRLACTDLRLFSIQFQHFLDQIQSSGHPFTSHELVDIFVLLLPRIVDVTSIAGLLQRNLSENETQRLGLRLGPALPIFCGAVIAHHVLDLQQVAHRAALCRLVQMDAIYADQQRSAFGDDLTSPELTIAIAADAVAAAAAQEHDRSHIPVYRGGDLATLYRGGTSQNGDFSGFRNVKFNGEAMAAKTLEELAASFGDAGLDSHPELLQGRAILTVDYAGVLRAPVSAAVASELQIGILLHKCGLNYSAAHVRANPRLARMLPNVLVETWASAYKQRAADAAWDLAHQTASASRQQNSVGNVAQQQATAAAKDLVAKAYPEKLTTQDSFLGWLAQRGVPCAVVWPESTKRLAYLEFAGRECCVDCDVAPGERAKGRKRMSNIGIQHVQVHRVVHVVRVRISSPLLEKVLTWRYKATNDENGAAATARRRSSSSSSRSTKGCAEQQDETRRTTSARRLQRKLRKRWSEAVAAIERGGELKVQTYITSRLRLDADGRVVISPARAAARAVVAQLRTLMPDTLDEKSVRILFRTRQDVDHSPVEPRTLFGAKTRAFVYYYEAFVPGIPDELPQTPGPCGLQYAWTPSEEAEDIPARTQSLHKVVATFRIRTSACFFTSAQVRSIVDVFLLLAKDQGLDISDYSADADMETDNGGADQSAEQGNRRSSVSSTARRDSVILDRSMSSRRVAEPSISAFDKNLLDLVAHLFGRVVDVENFFRTCIARMPLHLRNALIDRVGWLNVLNVEHCETRYELDLRHTDHWKLAHILTQLAANEEGINFRETSFCRTHEDPPIPGWSLPASWDVISYTGNLSKGVPRCGLLKVTYVAEPGDTAPFRRRLGELFTLSMGVPRPYVDSLDSACRVATGAFQPSPT